MGEKYFYSIDFEDGDKDLKRLLNLSLFQSIHSIIKKGFIFSGCTHSLADFEDQNEDVMTSYYHEPNHILFDNLIKSFENRYKNLIVKVIKSL